MSGAARRPRRHSPKSQENPEQEFGPAKGLESRLVATMLVTRVVDDGRNLDALCDASHGLVRFLGLVPNDRALARAIAITTLRNRNRIELALKQVMDRKPPANARFLNHSLQVAAAQILFMEVPDSAAVNLGVTAIKRDKRTGRFASFGNAVLRRLSREKEKILQATSDVQPFPAWLKKRLSSDFGKKNATRIGEAIMQPSQIDITVKSDPQKWAKALDGIVLPSGSVRLLHAKPVHELEGYEQGEWWVQDAAAALPARLVNAETGADVLELCAAPGGKTAQLANAGYRVTALDISKPRLQRLQENLRRLQLSAELVEADILEWDAPRQFDAVLLDAPCSSTGTMRRHPDVMWARRAEEITELANLQFELVKRAATFVKPGGTLVFSNCSICKEEGENLIAPILEACPDLQLEMICAEEVYGISELINGQGALRSLPFHLAVEGAPNMSGMDGFFACRFTRQ